MTGGRNWQFTFTADPDLNLDLDNITFGEVAGTGGPTNFELIVNGDSMGVFSPPTSVTARNINLSAVGRTNSAPFQFVAWGAPNTEPVRHGLLTTCS